MLLSSLAIIAVYFAAKALATAGIAAVTTVGALAIVATSLGSLSAARPNYGVDQWPVIPDEMAQFQGAAGVNVVHMNTLGLLLSSATPAQASEAVTVKVSIDGRQAGQFSMMSTESRRVRYTLKQPEAYVELTAQTADGKPAVMRVRIE